MLARFPGAEIVAVRGARSRRQDTAGGAELAYDDERAGRDGERRREAQENDMLDFMGLMKQAQAMQAKMAEMQAELDQVVVEGEAGGGLVKVTMTAKGALQRVAIDPSLLKPEESDISRI